MHNDYVTYPNCKVLNIHGANYSGYTNYSREGCRAVIIKDKSILLSHETNIGQWMIPGGGVEVDETPEECIIREIAEETGYTIIPKECFLVMKEYYEDWKFVSYFFTCEITGTTKRAPTTREIEVGAQPEFIDMNKAIEIFSHHADYTETNEERRGIYLREYTALEEYLKLYSPSRKAEF